MSLNPSLSLPPSRYLADVRECVEILTKMKMKPPNVDCVIIFIIMVTLLYESI